MSLEGVHLGIFLFGLFGGELDHSHCLKTPQTHFGPMIRLSLVSKITLVSWKACFPSIIRLFSPQPTTTKKSQNLLVTLGPWYAYIMFLSVYIVFMSVYTTKLNHSHQIDRLKKNPTQTCSSIWRNGDLQSAYLHNH